MRRYISENWPVISLLITIIFMAGASWTKLNSLDSRVSRLENVLIRPAEMAAK